jgi:outer membrane protein TolC
MTRIWLISQPQKAHGTLIGVINENVMKDGMGRSAARGLSVAGAAVLIGASALGHAVGQETPAAPLPSAPSATQRPLVLTGGLVIEREQPGAVRLTLDDAIATALRQNTEIRLRRDQEDFVHGQLLTVGNALAPNISAEVYAQAQEIDLAALGFKPGTLTGFKINGKAVGMVAPIQKVQDSAAQINLSQAVFNVPAFMLYRAARRAVEATNWQTLNSRGGVVLATGGLYLRALADAAQVQNAAGLVKQDELVYEHAKAAKDAGTGINLDVLRAQVDLQMEQQALVQAENAEAKDKVALNREMNQPAGQNLDLVDTVPFAEFDEMSLEDALKVAYVRRKDLRGLEAQLEVAEAARKAVRYERLPSLGVGGYYGVVDVVGSVAHGNFVAEGQMQVPIFEEGTLRGQKEVAVAQERGLKQQIESTRASIEAEIKSSMLDVDSARELVKVARSNVELASQALSDATLRFTSGVDDNLPVVRAQAALVGAQTQVIQAEFQYNYAKLTLARDTGVVETEYKQFLGR